MTVLKLEVDGAEIEILKRLLATGRLTAIEHAQDEMHDRKSRDTRSAPPPYASRLTD